MNNKHHEEKEKEPGTDLYARKRGEGSFWKWLATILVGGALTSMGFMCVIALDTRNEVASMKATLKASIESGKDRDSSLDSRVTHVELNVARLDKNQSRMLDKLGMVPTP